ncbi:ATP-binding protein [Kitasatospora sp. CB02891]|uniref:ATP-binding protein n=1 Tax=Kitasatospora sp. CB02891 TaxID=2020329 RepID=UPI0018E21EB9|nr:ATP-binding protein [Kitasatospora sp. CB02891]
MEKVPAAAGVTLPCVPEAAKAARELVRTRLAHAGLAEVSDDAVMVVSEIVGNSVRHSGTRYVRIWVTCTGRVVRISVADSSRTLPTLIIARDADEGHRGLGLVDALSYRWGADLLELGKVVWAEFETRPAPSFGSAALENSSDLGELTARQGGTVHGVALREGGQRRVAG